jgi:hypothetical protein
VARNTRIEQTSTIAKPPRDKTKPRLDIAPSTQKAPAARPSGTGARRRIDEPAKHACDPATPETEFMHAMQEYKKSSGRMFPTWSEVLEVLQHLGYRKPEQDASTAAPAPGPA